MSFIQLPHVANENDGIAQTALILSSEILYTVTFDVITGGGTATGECYV